MRDPWRVPEETPRAGDPWYLRGLWPWALVIAAIYAGCLALRVLATLISALGS